MSNLKIENPDKISRSIDCVAVISDRDISLGEGAIKVEDSTDT